MNIKINLTIEIDGVPISLQKDPWKTNPAYWTKAQLRKVSREVFREEIRYIPQIKYVRVKADSFGFNHTTGFGLKEAKKVVDRMIEYGFIRKSGG